jgi:outer membrane lipoprotein-sorting protein
MNLPVALRLACAALSFAAPSLAAAADAPALAPLHSFRMLLVDATPQGTASREITFVAPDKLRIEVPESSMVLVAIAKNVWLRDRDGRWQKAEYAPGVDPLADIRPTLDIAHELTGPRVRYAGLEKLDGVPTKVYDIVAAGRSGTSATTTRIWIGASDGYPHRVRVRSGETEFTATYSSWNQALSVSGP